MMRQTGAILLDAYRELNARKLFWVVLGLTLLAVVIFALLGINDRGVTFAVWTFEIPGLNSNTLAESTFYKIYFVNLGIGIWLAWIATILALVSTASVIPDFVSSGSIELALSKPIGRLRLFLTKYVASLLFVVLQVAVFALGSFLVIGLRGGEWIPTVFLAIPIVTIFFSYLYCICALLGLITKSPVASLLLTILIWFILFLLQQAETGLVGFKSIQEVQIERAEAALQPVEAEIPEIEAKLQHAQEGYESNPTNDNEFEVDRFESRLAGRTERKEALETRIESLSDSLESLETWQDRAYAVKTVLPKTAETIALLERWLIPLEDLPMGQSAEEAEAEASIEEAESAGFEMDEASRQEASLKAQEEIRDRPLWWVLGTSLVFEFIVLGVASWIFVRRDF